MMIMGLLSLAQHRLHDHDRLVAYRRLSHNFPTGFVKSDLRYIPPTI